MMPIYLNTRFERASRSRYHFGSLYRGEDGVVYIKLNLQIRFTKEIVSIENKGNERPPEERLNRKFMLEFNYNSNHIEGNNLTYGQTELLLMFGRVVGNAYMKDLEEMKIR